MVHYLVYPQGKTADEKTASLNRIVDGFNLDLFVKQFEESGADWLIFTLGQNSGYYCSPNDWLDKALPGHTSRRDLALEISKRVKALGKRFIAYLPAEVHGQCADVHKAFAWNNADQSEFEKRYPAFIRAYALKFGKNLDGWWFDGCYMYLPFMTKYDWPVWLAAARAGNPDTIVALNPGWINYDAKKSKPLTPLQDYMAGEMEKLPLQYMPTGRFVDGVQWHALMPLDGVFGPGKPHSYEDKVLFDWVKRVKDVGGAVTLNVPISQGGTMQYFPGVKDAVNGQMHLPTIAQLKRLSKAVKATQKQHE